MGPGLKLITVIFLGLILFVVEAKKSTDLYKVLGVDRNASQRDIQKAFHKLSLYYHPDKNKNKGAQAKFEEINNAYDILSDGQKRKSYDIYGDESGGPTFDGGNSNGGTLFGFYNIFLNLFGGDMGRGSHSSGSSGANFGGSRSSTGSQSGRKSSFTTIRVVNSQVYEKEIKDNGTTWLLVSYTLSMSILEYESILDSIGESLKGALKVGKLNCERYSSFCTNHGLYPHRDTRIFVYSYITSEGGSFVEYTGDLDVKMVKTFCQDNLPRLSKRISLDNFEPLFGTGERVSHVMLLSNKKDTPVIWRTLSGLFRNRFVFYDAQVLDVSDTKVKRLGVDTLPAIVGWLSNGEKHVLETGISVKDLESAVRELSHLLQGFDNFNDMIAWSKSESESSLIKQIQQLTSSNLDSICGEQTPVCVIGGFRSSKAREKIESILMMVSQKSLSRRSNLSSSSSSHSKDSISYAMLDATKQQTFLNGLDSSGFKSSNGFLVAYKPRKGKYAAFTGDLSVEEAEKFISSVLNGDVRFNKIRQKPIIE